MTSGGHHGKSKERAHPDRQWVDRAANRRLQSQDRFYDPFRNTATRTWIRIDADSDSGSNGDWACDVTGKQSPEPEEPATVKFGYRPKATATTIRIETPMPPAGGGSASASAKPPTSAR